MTPLFTILICTYERARILPKAVESVLRQTVQDFEIVVVDDGSQQDARGALEGFDDPRLRVFSLQENGGVSRATNIGLEKARGRYVTFLDDDDEFVPHFLEETKRHLERKEVDFCWCGVKEHFQDGTPNRELVITYPNQTHYERQMMAVCIGTGFGFTIKRECLDRVPEFDENLRSRADADSFISLVQGPWRWSGIPKALVKVYRQEQRFTLVDARFARSLEYIVKKHEAFLSTHQAMNSALAFQLGTILADCGQRAWARRSLWRYLRSHPRDLRIWTLLISNELRHYWIGLKLLQVYRFFYHRHLSRGDGGS